MKKARYFITCHELPVRTIHEVSPEVVRQILIRKTGGKKRMIAKADRVWKGLQKRLSATALSMITIAWLSELQRQQMSVRFWKYMPEKQV